jgi:hypothetical protein
MERQRFTTPPIPKVFVPSDRDLTDWQEAMPPQDQRQGGLVTTLLLSWSLGRDLGGSFLSNLSLVFVGQGQVSR